PLRRLGRATTVLRGDAGGVPDTALNQIEVAGDQVGGSPSPHSRIGLGGNRQTLAITGWHQSGSCPLWQAAARLHLTGFSQTGWAGPESRGQPGQWQAADLPRWN